MATLETRLDAVYNQLATLRPDSQHEELEKFAALFADDCTAYLKSMREHAEPAIGRQAVIQGVKELLKDQYLEKRVVVSQSVSGKDSRVFCEMETRYIVHTQPLDPFYETAVVVFNDDGLVTSFKQYSCRSHFAMLIQKATGVGPYHESFLA